jgi:hypothetical protein
MPFHSPNSRHVDGLAEATPPTLPLSVRNLSAIL